MTATDQDRQRAAAFGHALDAGLTIRQALYLTLMLEDVVRARQHRPAQRPAPARRAPHAQQHARQAIRVWGDPSWWSHFAA